MAELRLLLCENILNVICYKGIEIWFIIESTIIFSKSDIIKNFNVKIGTYRNRIIPHTG